MTAREDTRPGGDASRRVIAAWEALRGWLFAAALVAGAAALAGRAEGAAVLALPGALLILVGWIAWEDLRHLTIPDAALAAIAGLALVDLAGTPLFRFDPAAAFGLLALDALVCGGMLFAVREIHFRRRGYDGIGFGDVKLAAAGGCLCGLGGFALALLLASLAGLCAAAAGRHRADLQGVKIAFGALLAPALWVVWFWGGSR